MPTAPKIIAALCLAVLAAITSEIIKTVMPASTDFGAFTLVNAGVAFLCGWLVVGTRAGRGMSAAISNGFTGTVAMVFWCLFVQATNQMVADAMSRHYDGPVEAFAAIFEIGVEYAATMANAQIILTLLVGAIVVGVITEFAAGRWR